MNKNGIFVEYGWGEVYNTVYVWGTPVWNTYKSVELIGGCSKELDERLCAIAFAKNYFLYNYE